METLVLRHEKFEGLGYFAEALDARGVAFSYRDLGTEIVTERYDALVIMGGPMSANDPLPGLALELKLIETVRRRFRPICRNLAGSLG